MLAEVAQTSDRVVLIEDTRELQCAAPNVVALRTKDVVASLCDLVRSSQRLRPARIPQANAMVPLVPEWQMYSGPLRNGGGQRGTAKRKEHPPPGFQIVQKARGKQPAREEGAGEAHQIDKTGHGPAIAGHRCQGLRHIDHPRAQPQRQRRHPGPKELRPGQAQRPGDPSGQRGIQAVAGGARDDLGQQVEVRVRIKRAANGTRAKAGRISLRAQASTGARP
jgi:hypothetical protein